MNIEDELEELNKQKDLLEDILIECDFCGKIKKENPTPDGDEICSSCGSVLN